MVIVSLAAATICFAGSCYPALIGNDTPVGQYELIQRYVETPGYGGDVIEFSEDTKNVYAIHRIWTLKPEQHREMRIKSSNPKDHVITKGCINVEPEVYQKLLDCCSNDVLIIKR